MPRSPRELLERWWAEAEARGGPKARALVLATATASEGATARYVLPHGMDAAGDILFGTSVDSQKAQQLKGDARCELVWRDGDRQVRVRGTATVKGPGHPESQRVFAALPPGCRFGLTLLRQGAEIGEADHKAKLDDFEARYSPEAAPSECPGNYTALVVRPTLYEFYQGGHPGYVNDRFVYTREGRDFALRSRLMA